MQNLFNRTRPDRDAVRQIKELISEGFGLPETTTLTVAELRCHEPGCLPIETVITARRTDGSVLDWRIVKPIKDITSEDVESLTERW
jgi:hypothetical protein